MVHEGGHALFSHFKDFLAVAGGTILQLVAPAPVGAPLAISTLGAEERSSRAPARLPLLLALAFHVRREAVGYALFLLIVFENLLYVARYMADARAFLHRGRRRLLQRRRACPIPNMHDWYNLFSRFGVLQYDTRIAAAVFKLAWLGMIGTVLWFALRCYRSWRAGWE